MKDFLNELNQRLNPKHEYEAWQKVVTMLLDLGAVTPADCSSPVGSTGTPGQRLYTALREWDAARQIGAKSHIREKLAELEAQDKQKWVREINALRWAVGL